MKRFKRLFTILLVNVLFIPTISYADSGFDAKYDDSSSGSIGELAINAGGSSLSFFGELVKSKPNEKGYKSRHVTTSVISTLLFYIFTNVFLFRLKKPKLRKDKFSILGFTLIPTILFLLLCLFTKLQLILYFFLAGLYILIFKIISSIILKKRFKNKLIYAKEIDNNFDANLFNNEAFNIYKDVQEAWMNFNLKSIKKVISKDLYDKYQEQLDDLKNKGQKNIMGNIEYKSNKITDIDIEDNKLIIDCLMTITCNDYVINKEEKVIKGKKDKKLKYIYKLTYIKNNKEDNYVLVNKKMNKQS